MADDVVVPGFLGGGGRMGGRIRAHGWERTALGRPETWPNALQTLVGLMLAANQPMFVAWGAGRTLLFNDAYAEILAERQQDALGKDFLEVWNEIREDLAPIVAQAYAGAPVRMDRIHLRMHRRGRSEDAFFSFFYAPVRDEGGGVCGFFCACTETTEQVRAERRAAEERERLRRLFEEAPSFMAMTEGPEHRYVLANPRYVAVIGGRRCVGRTVAEVVPEAIEQGYGALFDEVFRTGRTYAAAGAPFERDGETRHVDFVLQPMTDSEGQVTGIFIEGYDVTGRVLAEREAQAANERVRLALDAGAIIGTWDWDLVHDRFAVDERFAESFGLDPAIGREGLPLTQVIANVHPDDLPGLQAAIAEAIARGGPYRHEYRVRRRDGAYRWLEANGRVDLAADGTPLRFPGVLLDIEGRRATEAERDRVAALLAAVMESVPGVVYAKDREGRILVANRGTAELIGRPPEAFLGRTDAEFLDDPAEAAAVMANDRRIMENGEAEQVEEEVRLADGTPAVWLSTKAPLRDREGHVVGLVGSSVDITARKRAERQLRELNETLEQRVAEAVAARAAALAALHEAQKMETVGQLTGGVAHDFNNLLTPILGGLDMALRDLPEGARSRQLAGVALQAAERARTLVQRLLAFGRRQPLQPRNVSLHNLVADMLDLVSRSIGPQVELAMDVPAALPAVRVDPNQLELAILNLAVNARDAMPEGGRLHISAAAQADPPGLRPGAYVVLRVADTGAGMDPDTLARAAEPFFTTKEVGQGTGLGLSMVHGLAAQSGGALLLASELGKGTVASLLLPVADEATESRAAGASPRA
ncbi:MAG: PAS domain-containing protein [Acetobacteraceae bacterium]|nr:PAS domain-containing protein [Acetobacteraceae bacterium]